MKNILPSPSVFISMIILFIGFSLFMDNYQEYGRSISIYKVRNIDSLEQIKTEEEIDILFASKPAFNKKIIESLPFQWSAPDDWAISQANMMQLMAYSVQTGTASVSILEGSGGGIILNVNRWRRQLSLPPMDKKDIQDMAKTLNMPFGQWHIFKIINTDTKQATYGALVQNVGYTIFVKLTGELPILQNNAKMFMELIMSFEHKSEEAN